MRFIGVDLAWSNKSWTGLAVVESGRVIDSSVLRSTADIVDTLRDLAQGPSIVAIDAPLIVPNLTGRRPCDAAISHCFGPYEAGAYPANLGLPAFRLGIRGALITSSLGLALDPNFGPGEAVLRAIEVYPHPATVALFSLTRTLKYKYKRKRDLANPTGRAEAFETLIALLEGLTGASPPLDVTASPRWEVLKEEIRNPRSRAAVDRAEDEIDAYICAYVALYYWTYGTERCRVVGDVANGYIVTPVTEQQAACLDALNTSAIPTG